RFLPGHLIAWSDDHEYPAVALMLEQDCKQPLRLALNIDVIPFGARDGHLGDILRNLRDRLQAKVLFAPAIDIVEQAADRAAEGCYADFGVAGLECLAGGRRRRGAGPSSSSLRGSGTPARSRPRFASQP